MRDEFQLTVENANSILDIIHYHNEHHNITNAITLLENGIDIAEQIDYKTLIGDAKSIAATLQENAKPGDRALLLYPHNLDFIRGFLGCLYAGIIAIPVPPPSPNKTFHRIASVVENAQPSLILTTSSVLDIKEKLIAIVPDLSDIPWISAKDIKTTSNNFSPINIKQDDIAFLQYTSGSTSDPKGVMVSHGNILNNLKNIKKSFAITKDDVILTWLPFYHDMGLIGTTLEPLYAGAPLVLMPPHSFIQKPLRWLNAISKFKATITGGPNFGYDLCVQKISDIEENSLDLSSLKLAFNGAEPVRKETLQAFASKYKSFGFDVNAFYPCFGMAETTLLVSGPQRGAGANALDIDKTVLEKDHKVALTTDDTIETRNFVSCGSIIAEHSVVIVDYEKDTICSNDEIGEIWVKGPGVTQGYWNNSVSTEHSFHGKIKGNSKDNFLRTGDLGFIHENELYITGRIKDLIILRGHNYYPQDIELAAVDSHKAIAVNGASCFVVEVDGVEQLVLVCELIRQYKKYSFDEIFKSIRKAVFEEFNLDIHTIELISPVSLPKTTSGKVQRQKTREQFLADALRTIDSHSKGGNLEEVIEHSEDHHLHSIVELRTVTSEEKQKQMIAEDITEVIIHLVHIPKEEFNINEPLGSYGFDSIDTIKIKQLAEDNFNAQIDMDFLLSGINTQNLIDEITFQFLEGERILERSLPIVIAATYTVEPVAESIEYLLRKADLEPQITFAHYNQVFQELLNPGSLIHQNSDGVNVVLMALEDWLRFEEVEKLSNEEIISIFQKNKDTLIQGIESVIQKGNKILISLMPVSPKYKDLSDTYSIIIKHQTSIKEKLKNTPGVTLLDPEIRNISNTLKEVFDPISDTIGHIPYKPEFYALLGNEIARTVSGLYREPYKVIVLDCDNTLWKGVCGEVGAEQVLINGGYKTLQQFMQKQLTEGKLLCLCSKNSAEDVEAVFEKNSNMVLRKEDITLSKVNWNKKSDNLKEIANELNLDLNSFIFIDDNPVECAEVRSHCPEALVIELPQNDDHFESYFENHWAFDSNTITEEDKNRAKMYQQNIERNSAMEKAGNFECFLKDLEIDISIEPLDENGISRFSQLTQRTNQFNATTIRRSESEIASLQKDSTYQCFTVDVSDRFGSYGIVGALILKNNEQCEVDTFLLSCRVLGRQVEQTMMKRVASFAKEKGYEEILLKFNKSAKNIPIATFYNALLNKDYDCEHNFTETIPTSEIDKRIENAQNVQYQVLEKNSQKKSAGKALVSATQRHFFHFCATELHNISALVKFMKEVKRKRPDIGQFITPRNPLQKSLAQMWCEILGLESVGIDDSFFDLGGDSLKAAEMVAQLSRKYGSGLSISIMESPTIVGIEQAIIAIQNNGNVSVVEALSSLAEEAEYELDFDKNHIEIEDKIEKVFITGTTGYLGAHLIKDIFEMSNATLYCHVRAKNEDEGFERIRKNLMNYHMWIVGMEDRIIPILGDLSMENLGLSPEMYHMINADCDAIYHNGAWVNFIYPYSMLKSANIDGTIEILKLASTKRVIPVHFISTLGVLMSGQYEKGQVLLENEKLTHSEELPNGYEQTKWVADMIVYNAIQKGFPASIYRVGMLSGQSATGVYHKINEFLPSVLKGSIQLGYLPLIDTKLEMVPIDFISKSIIHCSLKNEMLGNVYHMNHLKPFSIEQIIEWICGYGYKVEGIQWDIWKQKLISQDKEKLYKNALYPYLDFVTSLNESQTLMPEMDLTNFMKGIEDANFECVPTDELLKKYFDYFIKTGYLHAPEGVA